MRTLLALVFVGLGCGPVATPSNTAGPAADPLPDNAGEPAEPGEPGEPGSEPGEPVPLERAQAVVEGFLAALGNADVDGMMSYCATPFYLDREAFESAEALRAEMSQAADKMKGKSIEIVAIGAVSDWRAFADDYPGTETDLTAFTVLARVEGIGEEGMRFFVRMGDDPKLVAIKD